jgi:hypothetical protein
VDYVNNALASKISSHMLRYCHNTVRNFLVTQKVVIEYNRTGTKNINVPKAKKALPDIFVKFMKLLYAKLPHYSENPDGYLKDFFQAWNKVTDKPKLKKVDSNDSKHSNESE